MGWHALSLPKGVACGDHAHRFALGVPHYRSSLTSVSVPAGGKGGFLGRS